MATTPKKNAPEKKPRSRMALIVSVLMVACVCGAVAMAVAFQPDSKASKTSTSIAATTLSVPESPVQHSLPPSTGTVMPPPVATTPACEQKQCKVGGKEVCGTDGKTYLNDCFYENAHCKNASVNKVENWNGFKCPNKCKKQITCKEVAKYICASDGNVYFGYCNLYIAQCLDESVKEVECDPAIHVTRILRN